MKLHKWFMIGLLLTALLPKSVADEVKAEDVAYRMARRYVEQGFNVSPITERSGIMGAGQSIRFLIPVAKGLDYAFLVGGDAFALDIDVYVYDEVGGLILDDRRRASNAGVRFRSSYNGTAIVYVSMARANGLASWCILVGRRGLESEKAPIASNEEPVPGAPTP